MEFILALHECSMVITGKHIFCERSHALGDNSMW